MRYLVTFVVIILSPPRHVGWSVRCCISHQLDSYMIDRRVLMAFGSHFIVRLLIKYTPINVQMVCVLLRLDTSWYATCHSWLVFLSPGHSYYCSGKSDTTLKNIGFNTTKKKKTVRNSWYEQGQTKHKKIKLCLICCMLSVVDLDLIITLIWWCYFTNVISLVWGAFKNIASINQLGLICQWSKWPLSEYLGSDRGKINDIVSVECKYHSSNK